MLYLRNLNQLRMNFKQETTSTVLPSLPQLPARRRIELNSQANLDKIPSKLENIFERANVMCLGFMSCN